MAIRVPFLLRKVEYWQWMGPGWAGSAANIRHSSAISLSGLPTLGFSQHPCRGGAMQGPLRLPQLKIPQQCWEPVRGTPGESSPSACGCGDDHGHPLPAGWFGCTAAGRFRIRQDRSRQPVRGAEGTTSPLSRNCFAGQRRGWGVWETSGWPWGGTALSAGSASHAGSLRASPRALFLFEGWASSPSKLQRVADAQSPRRRLEGIRIRTMATKARYECLSGPPQGERTCSIRVTAGRMGGEVPYPPTDGKDFPL